MEPRGTPLVAARGAPLRQQWAGKARLARTFSQARREPPLSGSSQPQPGKRRRVSPLAAAFALAVGAALSSVTCLRSLSSAWLLPQATRPEERAAAPNRLEPGRREAAALLAASAAWLRDLDAAAAESSPADMIVASGRSNAAREAKEGGFLGANRFKKDMGNYNYTDVQSFLPSLYLSRMSFNIQLKQLDNKKFDLGSPEAWTVLRNINRDEPNRKIRKELYRTQLWIKDKNKNKPIIADLEYERIKRAIDECDTQYLLLSRLDERVSNAAIKQAKRNVQAIIDGIDELLGLIPKEELQAAKAVADTKKVAAARLPLKRKKSTLDNSTNATEGSDVSTAASSQSSPAKQAAPAVVAKSSTPFGSMAMDIKD